MAVSGAAALEQQPWRCTAESGYIGAESIDFGQVRWDVRSDMSVPWASLSPVDKLVHNEDRHGLGKMRTKTRSSIHALARTYIYTHTHEREREIYRRIECPHASDISVVPAGLPLLCDSFSSVAGHINLTRTW
jgi:hypothetical protein